MISQPSSSSETPSSSTLTAFDMIIATFRQDGSATERIASSIRDVFMDAPNDKTQRRRATEHRMQTERAIRRPLK
jgi:hypothetical protein